MGRGRKPAKELSSRDIKIVERYRASVDTMPRLAEKYGISKQRIYEILLRAKRFGYITEKPKLLTRHHTIHRCKVCSKIFRVAAKNDLMTKKQLAQRLNIKEGTCHWHLNQLKRLGLISKSFATIRSDKLVKALRCYKKGILSTAAVGRKFGYKNFYSILSYQKKKGLNVRSVSNSPIAPDLKLEGQVTVFPSRSRTYL
jgi:DNA-binding Lrp family transcriptional regulator